jgi:uncharacterized protein with PQ loop repeat
MTERSKTARKIWRTFLEMGFIIFLFYSNLLMGQYNLGHRFSDKPLLVAAANIVTLDNFIIAVVAAFVGHVVFDFIRRRL